MKKKNFTFIKTNKRYIKIEFDKIAYIKGLGNYVEIMMTTKIKYIYYKSMKDLIDNLPNEFMRIHNSYIVNLTTVDTFEDNHIIVQNHKIAVGKTYKECLKNSLEKSFYKFLHITKMTN